MKKLIVLLLALMMVLPVYAEEAEGLLAPFVITTPEGTTAVNGTGGASMTFLHPNGTTRVVAMVLRRVPDQEADLAAMLQTLLAQLEPQAQPGAPLKDMTAGFHGLKAIAPGVREGLNEAAVDQVMALVMWQTALEAELLILAGYDMAGDTAAAEGFIDALLAGAAVRGAPVMALPALTDTQPAG